MCFAFIWYSNGVYACDWLKSFPWLVLIGHYSTIAQARNADECAPITVVALRTASSARPGLWRFSIFISNDVTVFYYCMLPYFANISITVYSYYQLVRHVFGHTKICKMVQYFM